MTTPREPFRSSAGDDSGASAVSAASAAPKSSGSAAVREDESEERTTLASAVSRGRARWEWAQRTRPWRAFSRFVDVGGNVLSAGMSYQALFAVFAGLYVGFSMFGIWLRNRPELLQGVLDQLDMFLPGLLGSKQIDIDTLLNASRVLDWTSILAGASLLWVALAWFTGTRRAIRIIFGLEVKQYRNPVLLKLRDLALAVGFFVAILVSAALTVFSSNLVSWLVSVFGGSEENWLLGGLGVAIRYIAMYVFDVIVLLAIHRFLAEVRVGRWHLLHGCAIGGIVLFGIKVLGTLLLGGASSNPLLATFAVFIGLLLWFNLICRTLLLTAAWIATGVDRTLGLPDPA